LKERGEEGEAGKGEKSEGEVSTTDAREHKRKDNEKSRHLHVQKTKKQYSLP